MNKIEKLQKMINDPRLDSASRRIFKLYKKIYDLNQDIGHVYLIQLGDTDVFKIGITNNINRRISQLQSKSPIPLNLIYQWTGHDYHAFESILHKTFEKKRVKGEWFKLTAGDLMKIHIMFSDSSHDNAIFTNKN